MRSVTPKLISILLAIAALALPSRAQDGEDFSGDRPGRPNAPAVAGLTARGSGEVSITVRSFGLGNIARPGEWIGVAIEVSDSSDKVRNVMIRIANPDLDGDTALMQRVIITNPGSPQLLWDYMRFPFANTDSFEISAYEAVSSGGGSAAGAGGSGGGAADTEIAAGEQRYQPGRMLGTIKYGLTQNRQIAPVGIGLIGVIGTRDAGLEQYQWVADPVRNEHAVTGHELTGIVSGLTVAGLPNRWYGYSQMDAIVWTSEATEDTPLNIREPQADAIREYVKRGGHFIVVLPNVGQNWIAQPNNPLADIMPAVKINRSEGVDLERYRWLLTRDPRVELPKDAIVQSFTPVNVSAAAPAGAPDDLSSGWGAPDAISVMAGPDKEVVVARRIVGCGMVTVVGINVTSQKLQRLSRGFEAQQFWNRILGKRLRIPTQSDLALGRKGGTYTNGQKADEYPENSPAQYIDYGVASAVNNEGSAATGLLLSFLVFVAYWCVAAGTFLVLKQRNMRQHAWVAFMAATALFTAIAWGGATALKPRRVNGSHLTILTGVYGQPNVTARSWMGVLLPRYGEQEFSVAAPAGPTGEREWKNLVATWDPPMANGSASWQSFPDARGYVVDSRQPDTAAFPARATTKQVQVDWAGALPAGWTMPHPVADPGAVIGKELRLVKREKKDGELDWALEGTIIHQLPTSITNLHLFVVRDPIETGVLDDPSKLRRRIAEMDFATDSTGDWKPGQPLVLDKLFTLASESSMDSLTRQIAPVPSGPIDSDSYKPEYVAVASAFMDLAKPPDPNMPSGNPKVLQRSSMHGLDLSKWSTQSCLILIGEVGDGRDAAECPVPVRIDNIPSDDVRKRLRGKTIVRWIYPLDSSPFAPYKTPIPMPAVSPTAPLDSESPGGAGGSGGTP